MDKLRIFLAEDHSVVRSGLKLLIDSQPDMQVIGEAGDGKAALDKAIELQPDVVIMDISMPEMNGDEVTRQLIHASPQIKVLALSVHEDKSYLRGLLDAGASGYLLKRAAAEELIKAIHVIVDGETYLDPTLAGKMASSLVQNPFKEGSIRESTLSLRESEVVRLIAQGYSNKEIAAQLDISVKTVETYKARAMEKLNMHSRADLVRYAIQHGWLERK